MQETNQLITSSRSSVLPVSSSAAPLTQIQLTTRSNPIIIIFNQYLHLFLFALDRHENGRVLSGCSVFVGRCCGRSFHVQPRNDLLGSFLPGNFSFPIKVLQTLTNLSTQLCVSYQKTSYQAPSYQAMPSYHKMYKRSLSHMPSYQHQSLTYKAPTYAKERSIPKMSSNHKMHKRSVAYTTPAYMTPSYGVPYAAKTY